jgi:hypothetical protein
LDNYLVAIWMRRNTAVPKKYEGNPKARGAVDRKSKERKQNTVPATIKIPDII